MPATTAKQHTRTQYLFPTPESVSIDSIVFYCDAERVMSIYNKEHNSKRQKLTLPVQQWFINEARRCGWAQAEFIYNVVKSNTNKACLLTKPSAKELVYASPY
ncbi:hypothetical protein [Shewanella surugensis]|uniref:Uncharacterized protein n=1 Tax=Shewanella surugensis TaxID=212020 RepID=A0ABT0LDR2_9GAMM|nr:hypothetical protein [Shewanella surugensis]MCL1125795.1 hypothetical protein [Shewanella surugensis]